MRLQVNNKAAVITKRDAAAVGKMLFASTLVGFLAYCVLYTLQGDPYTERARYAEGICPATGWVDHARVFTCTTDEQRDAVVMAAISSMYTVALTVAIIVAVITFAVMFGTFMKDAREQRARALRPTRTTSRYHTLANAPTDHLS